MAADFMERYEDFPIPTLLKLTVESLVKCLPVYIEDVTILPENLKQKLLKRMSQRGLITDENLKQIITNNLKVLDLSECDVSDVGLLTLTPCKNLRKIDLNAAKDDRLDVTSVGAIHIANSCPLLEVVYLRRCINLTDEGVKAIATNCSQIRELNVGGCIQLTNQSLTAIGQHCKHLSSLNISRTNVTDDGIINFALAPAAKSLEEFHINGCVKLTDEAVEAVVYRCPVLNVFILHGCPSITDQSRLVLGEFMNSKVKHLTWTVY